MFVHYKSEKNSSISFPNKVIVHNSMKYSSMCNILTEELNDGRYNIEKTNCKNIYYGKSVFKTEYPVKSFVVKKDGKILFMTDDSIFNDDCLLYKNSNLIDFKEGLDSNLIILTDDGLYELDKSLSKICELKSPISFDIIDNGYIVGNTECLMFIDYKGNKYSIFTSKNDDFQGFDMIQVNGGDIYYKELEDLYSPEEIYKFNIRNYKFSRILRVEDMEGFSLDGDKIIHWTQFQIN